MTTDFKTLLKGAKLPERTVQVCLRGDLRADFEAAERELNRLQSRDSNSLAGNGAGELVDRIEALQADMREHTYTFVLRALPKPAFRALVNAHPPRRTDDGEVVDDDRMMDINTETFWDDLIRTSVVDPELDDETWNTLQESLTDYQFNELSLAAWGLNRSEVDIPFSSAASKAKRDSGGE